MLLWQGNSVVQFQYSRLHYITIQYSTAMHDSVDCTGFCWEAAVLSRIKLCRLSGWMEGVCLQCKGRGCLERTTRCSYLMGGQLARCWCWDAGILLQEVSGSSHRDPSHLKFNAKHFFSKITIF